MLFTASSNDFQSMAVLTYGFLIHSILSITSKHAFYKYQMGKTEILTTNKHIKKNLYICYSSFSKNMFLSYEQPQRSKEICCAFFCYSTKVNRDNKGFYIIR